MAVRSDAFDFALIAAARLNHVAVGIANEARYLAAFAEADRPLGDCNIVCLQGRDCLPGSRRRVAQCRVGGELVEMSIRILLLRSPALALNTMLSSTPCPLRMIGNVIILFPAKQVDPEHPVEDQGTIQIMRPNASI
jgi:hypothetical protein